VYDTGLPVFSQEEFLSFLKDNQCSVVSTEHWNDFDTILLEKDKETFSLTLEPKYFYYTVVIKCLTLDILPPSDHLISFRQHYKNKPCFCKSGIRFEDCHDKKINELINK
jgi:hypothetical protein